MPPRPFSEAGGVLLSGESVGTPGVQRSAGQVRTNIAVGIGDAGGGGACSISIWFSSGSVRKPRAVPMRLTTEMARRTAVAAVTFFAAVQPAGIASANREFPTCIQSCNETRRVCRDQCGPDCAAIFPDSPVEQETCVSTCMDECVDESSDCGLLCRELKNPSSPEEP